MRKQVFNLILFIMLFTSCVSNKLNNSNYTNSDLFLDKEWNFFLQDNRPVIKTSINGVEFKFLIDSGAEETSINKNGIIKLNAMESIFNKFEEEYNKTKPESSPTYSSYSKKEIEYFISISQFYYTLKQSSDLKLKFRVDLLDNSSKEDGIIGIDFIKKNSPFTVDYKNNKIILNDSYLITDSEEPMEYCLNGRLVGTYIVVGDVKEFGLIDTGNYKFISRENIGISNSQKSDDYICKKIEENKKIHSSKIFHKKLHDVKIGNLLYTEIDTVSSDTLFLNASNFAKIFCQYYNSIGYEIFQNHIIQLDFDKMKFRIQ